MSFSSPAKMAKSAVKIATGETQMEPDKKFRFLFFSLHHLGMWFAGLRLNQRGQEAAIRTHTMEINRIKNILDKHGFYE